MLNRNIALEAEKKNLLDELGLEKGRGKNLDMILLQYSLELVDLRNKNSELEKNVFSLKSSIEKLSLRRPTESDLRSLLFEFPRRTYDEQVYVCIHFSWDLKQFSRIRGYNISFIVVNYEVLNTGSVVGRGHALNGAYLSDGSWVWIEPQAGTFIRGSLSSSSLSMVLKNTFYGQVIILTHFVVVW